MPFSSITIGSWWPLLLIIASFVVLSVAWIRIRGALFPDLGLLHRTAASRGYVDNLPFGLGALVIVLLVMALMEISATRVVEENLRARDFLVVVDTSRSMREDTALLRKEYTPTYPRQADLYVGQSEDPARIPNLGRYEVARESLIQFLGSRRDVDRVGLIYFNSMVYLMSGFTGNFAFIQQQLAGMDSYVTFGTNIRWALEQAFDLVERYPGRNRRAIILLTDAEARNTDFLQQQLDRARRMDIAFYLLWIQPQTGVSDSLLATDFLRTVREIGSVFTIDDMGQGYLDEALEQISRLEDYAYREASHERIDLSAVTLRLAQWLLLAWIFCIGTVWLPLSGLRFTGSGEAGAA